MLNKVGEMHGRSLGTPAGHGAIKDNVPWRLTCCVLPSKKPLVHNQKPLVTFMSASLSKGFYDRPYRTPSESQ